MNDSRGHPELQASIDDLSPVVAVSLFRVAPVFSFGEWEVKARESTAKE